MTVLADTLVFLCAGRGTRLTGRPERQPKPLVSVDGRPLLARLHDELAPLVAPTAERVFVTAPGDLAVSRLARSLHRDAVVIPQPRADGVVGALIAARSLLRDRTLIALGDLYVRGDVSVDREAEAAVVVWEDAPDAATTANFGVAERDGRVTSVCEKPRDARDWLCGIGLYLMTPKVIDVLSETPPDRRTGERGITDGLATAIDAGVDISVGRFTGDYCNVNTPDDLRAARELARRHRPAPRPVESGRGGSDCEPDGGA